MSEPSPAVLPERTGPVARITAREAERLGLTHHAVTAEARDALDTMADMDFEQGLSYLQGMLTVNVGTEDAIEGVGAFLEKRDPVWTGR